MTAQEAEFRNVDSYKNGGHSKKRSRSPSSGNQTNIVLKTMGELVLKTLGESETIDNGSEGDTPWSSRFILGAVLRGPYSMQGIKIEQSHARHTRSKILNPVLIL